MLQKGIIETIIDKYRVQVRIPKYDKVDTDAMATRTEDLPVGIICTSPGMKISYSVGDVVLVDFENNELNRPVILGLLYREGDSDSTAKFGDIDSSIESINDKIDELNSLSLYTHIKYSNDNGMTFTSLYDPTNLQENQTIDGVFYFSPKEKIQLDQKTNTIYWSVINKNNIDITKDIRIITKIRGINTSNKEVLSVDTNDKLFELPFESKLCKEIYLEFEIYLSKTDLNNYYISLTTDLESIGSVYGDYIGVCVSNEKEPSDSTKDYTWTSIINRNDININKLSDKLLSRIQANEKDLRGYSEDILDSSGNIIKSNVSLLDAISVTLNAIAIGIDRNNIYFGNVNQYIDTTDSSIHVNSLRENEFELVRRESNNNPIISLYYIVE